MGICLYISSLLWPTPEDVGAGLDSAGDAIVWGLTVFPVFAVCSLINIVWLSLIVLGGCKGKGWRSIRAWLLVMGAWFLLYRLEVYNVNHGSRFSTGNLVPGLAHLASLMIGYSA